MRTHDVTTITSRARAVHRVSEHLNVLETAMSGVRRRLLMARRPARVRPLVIGTVDRADDELMDAYSSMRDSRVLPWGEWDDRRG